MSETLATVRESTGTQPSIEEPLHRVAAIGGFLGVVAAAIGLLSFVLSVASPPGSVLIIPFLAERIVTQPTSYIMSAAFFGLLAIGSFLQYLGGRRLSRLLGSGYPSMLAASGVASLLIAIMSILATSVLSTSLSQVIQYGTNFVILGPVFVIIWQLTSVIYADSSKSYLGTAAGVCNGFFIPLFALGFSGLLPGASGPGSLVVDGALLAAAYALLLAGQLAVVLFWLRPARDIREYARSTDPAKIAFGLSGLLTFVMGLIPLYASVTDVSGTSLWMPWSTSVQYVQSGARLVFVHFSMPSWYALGFLAALLFWVRLAPRLGAKELRMSHIRADVITGGVKWFMVVLAIVGLLAAGFAGSLRVDTAGGFGLFLTICPAAIIFLMGMLYMSNNDVVTGLPLLVASVLMLILPYSLAMLTTNVWLLVILTQLFILIESRVRGLTVFSQTFLTVVTTIGASLAFVVFMLGGFGSGPPALWPANRWFNVTLFPGIDPALQAPTVFAIVILTLLVRNVAVVGYAYGRDYTGAGMIGVMTLLFAILTVIISGNFDITHQALTAAAIVFMLYTISFVLVLSLNLNLGSSVLSKGHGLEGNLLRVTAAYAMVFGAVVALVAFSTFSVLTPDAPAITLAITMMIALIVSLEILQMLGWLSAGIRLGLIRGGFRFTRIRK